MYKEFFVGSSIRAELNLRADNSTRSPERNEAKERERVRVLSGRASHTSCSHGTTTTKTMTTTRVSLAVSLVAQEREREKRKLQTGESLATCRRGGNVGADIDRSGASRSFSLSHPGPRTTHASAPDAPPPSPCPLLSSVPPPTQQPAVSIRRSYPRRPFSLSLSLSVCLPFRASVLLVPSPLFSPSSSRFRCRWLSLLKVPTYRLDRSFLHPLRAPDL